jgi:S-DNA-T family DNA segregation ATPase FtsK/SpoIIIE
MMRERVIREAIAVALLLGSLLMMVALVSHSPLDPSPFHTSTDRQRPVNLAGWLGASLSAALLGLLGPACVLLPVVGAIVGWKLLRGHELEHPRRTAVGWVMLLLSVSGFAHLAGPSFSWRGGAVATGGMVGQLEAELLVGFMGPVGRVVILAFFGLVGLLLVSRLSMGSAADGLSERVQSGLEQRRSERDRRRAQRDRERDRRKVLERQLERYGSERGYRGSLTVKEVEGRGRFRIVRRVADDEVQEQSEAVPKAAASPTSSARRRKAPARAEAPPAASAVKPVVQEEFDFIDDLDSYDLPKLSFLDETEERPERDTSSLIELAKVITTKCQEFRVRGEVVNIRTGPVITTYEFRLDSGIKISAVQNLSEDLALALKTESVRIERIPGRATVGIEVPAPDPETIHLRQLLETTEFQRSQSLLTLGLGVDIRGKPFVADLARMPHLLIGGFTGAGKSVGINAMIMSILYKARPDEVKFIFVDPKMVELGVYADLPHLLTPIINDPKKAANALGWAVAEMDNRYRRLAALGVRNLNQYNQLVRDPAQLKRVLSQLGDDTLGGDDLEPLPFIVIVIDELADLMIASGRAVEESITRLAQKARAVGLHLICATQRPSVDILTGIIKANFPCRIAYKVRSRPDSRTILDSVGAEHLLGRGDMLFLPPGTSQIMRLHGPYVSEKEIATVVRYSKRFGSPDYRKDVLTHAPLGDDSKGSKRTAALDDDGEPGDPMYDEAVRLVVSTRKASASYIQRRLRLGYTRSARLLDMMEKEGIVGPLDGSRGREVLVPENYFDEVDETHMLNGDESEVTG